MIEEILPIKYCIRIKKSVKVEYMCDLIRKKFVGCKYYNSSNQFSCIKDAPRKRKCLVTLSLDKDVKF